ncbi:2'-5' RNA ligase family protein [Spongisporangium articulatum]|uniref:2'-5' RNA ligase family protein n=1 Tax=Spongisporangium articulatum TaxID=3362603 RepID=A0ABW8APE4_9ACTN
MPVRPASAQDDLVTIGVVIDVPEPYGEELQRWRADFGDPLARAIPAHITLLPPTEVAAVDSAAIAEHLAEVTSRLRSFGVRLRGTDSFRPVSPVVFISLLDGADDCDRLQESIRTGPLKRELSFEYHPHVTVAHHLDEAALDRAQTTLVDYAADFTVDGVSFYEHGPSGWRLERRFLFGDVSD